ncbi:MAG: hypothetical protein GF353_00010 [Candidatus Lokiarchaeota archaeon]|nr:hypothetical protein [Candidatus Lokiarchaeota archaeon]
MEMRIKPEVEQKEAKKIELTDEQRIQIYAYCKGVSKDTVEEVCPALFRVVLNSEKGPLKNELGKVIFHLQKTERLNTIIGLEKLVDASLLVAPNKLFKILTTSDRDAKELAGKIKNILK